jgi:hypothetical protein
VPAEERDDREGSAAHRRNTALADPWRFGSQSPPNPPTCRPGFPSRPRIRFTGWVVCDDLHQLTRDELTDNLGALSPATISRVNAGLRIALAL